MLQDTGWKYRNKMENNSGGFCVRGLSLQCFVEGTAAWSANLVGLEIAREGISSISTHVTTAELPMLLQGSRALQQTLQDILEKVFAQAQKDLQNICRNKKEELSRNSFQEREVSESIYIEVNQNNYILNQKSGFNRCQIPRLSVMTGEKEYHDTLKKGAYNVDEFDQISTDKAKKDRKKPRVRDTLRCPQEWYHLPHLPPSREEEKI